MSTVAFYQPTGLKLDAYFTSNFTNLVWRNDTTVMAADADATATLAQQAVPLVESPDRAGKYTLTPPAGLPGDLYTISIRRRQGSNPGASDPELFANKEFAWDGANEVTAVRVIRDYEITQD